MLGTLLLCLLLCSEHCFLICIGCIAQIPRFRAVPSFLEPCFLARNSASLPASMLCSEHCCFACFYARNIASLPASVLGTLLPSMYARNPAFLPDPSALCLYLCSARNSASFNALLGTLLLCMFRASDYPCSLDHIWIGCIAQIPRFRAVPSFSKPGMFRAYDYQQCGKKM